MIGRKSERSRGRENKRKVEKQASHHPSKQAEFTQSSIKAQRDCVWGLALFTEAEATKIRALK